MLSGMSPGGGVSVPAAAGAALVPAGAAGEADDVLGGCDAGELDELPLHPAASSPAAARTRSRPVVAAALAMSMAGTLQNRW